jgi:uncharacterized protein YndB with AHSA1/START domain
MMIRRPVDDVFEAFVDPAITTKFWFTHSTGRLEAGRQVVWRWEMYGASAPVTVKAIEPRTRIEVEWGDPGQETTVEWTFQSLGSAGTYVRIVNRGFQGTPDERLAKMMDSTGGFSLLIAGAKAWLEHQVQLNLVGDKYPEELRNAV